MKSIFFKVWPYLFIIIIWRLFTQPIIYEEINNLKNPKNFANIPKIILMFLREPVLPRDIVPFPSDYQVNHFPPWSHFEKYWGPVKNGAMPDIISQIYPWRHLSINTFKTGEIPLWNPYNFSGNPHLANFQSAVLSPFNIFFFWLSFIDAWSLIVFLQPLQAGVFTYLLVREFKISKVGSLISSIAFMFCGFMVVWMAYATLSLAISFLPFALFAIERFKNTNKAVWLLLLSITFPLSYFSGHFQTSLYFTIFILAYIFFALLKQKDLSRLKLAIVYFCLGFLLTSPQVIPSIEFYLNSVRSSIYSTGNAMPFQYLITIFSPDFYGNPVTRNDWVGNYAEWASFVGIIPLLLSLFALFRRNSRVIFFAAAGLIALILAVESPLQSLLSTLRIPVISTSNASRVIVLFSFSFSILAGFGLDNLNGLLNGKLKMILAPLLIFSAFVISVWIILFFFNPLDVDKLIIAKRNMILPSALFIGAVIAVFASKFKRKLIPYVLFMLLIFVSVDSLRFANKWMPYGKKELVFQDIPLIENLKEKVGINRYFGNLGTEVSTYYAIGSIEGYDPLYIESFGEIARSTFGGIYQKAERSVAKFSRAGDYIDRTLDLLGVSVIFHPIADTNQGWAYPVWNKFDNHREIYRDGKYQLFLNNDALPKAFLYYDYEVIVDKGEAIKRLHDKNFDIRKKLILSEDIGFTITKGQGSADITSYTPNKIIVQVKSLVPGILFISDNYYPGWEAYVDNVKTTIYKADYSFRAIKVSQGKHEVIMKYEPLSFRIGVYIAIISVAGLLFTSLVVRKYAFGNNIIKK